MLSYTSNSSKPVPDGPWGKTWLLTIMTVALFLGAWEVLWRFQGFSPVIARDKLDIWVAARSRVKRNSIVSVGASRIQSSLQPEVFAVEMGGEPLIQLAVVGGFALPVLEDLAADQSFSGLVIVDLTPHIFFFVTPEDEEWVLEWIEAYKLSLASPARWSETRLRVFVEDMFVFDHPALSPIRIFDWLLKRAQSPQKRFFLMRSDRFTPLDFTKTDPKKREEVLYKFISTVGRDSPERILEAVLERIRRAVSQIQGRGGSVILLYLPSSGKVKEAEEERYPRRIYWDVLETRTGAISIHSDDYPTLANFHCPDGSHLDLHSASLFSKALARVLKSKGLVPRGTDY